MNCKKCKSYNILLEKGNYKFHDVFLCKSCNNYSCYPIDRCCRNPYHIVTIDRRNNYLFFLRYQCINCQGCTDMNKPLKASIYQEEIRSEFSLDGYQNWRNKKSEENKEIYEWISNHNYQQTSYYKDYICYLASDKWKEIREKVFSRDNNICQFCKVSPADQVHHTTYERLGNERLEDLLSICIPCHEDFHRKQEINI